MYLEADAAKELEQIWWPAITFANELSPRQVENQEIVITNDGTVEYREKFEVLLSTNFQMKRFPFDYQILIAEIESFAWNSNILQFHIEDDLVEFSHDFEIPEHNLISVRETLHTYKEPRDRYPFSELLVEIEVRRNPTYYITKIILPLTLIVCISWAVFWMDANELADRMAISFTGVLTSVAYQFVVADTLPKHIYNTFLDNFVTITFLLMVMTVVVNISVHQLCLTNRPNEALWIDRVCRVMFPAAFTTVSLVLAGAQIVTDYLPIGTVVGVCIALVASLFGMLAVYTYIHLHHGSSLDESKASTTDSSKMKPDDDDDDVENQELHSPSSSPRKELEETDKGNNKKKLTPYVTDSFNPIWNEKRPRFSTGSQRSQDC